MKFSPEQLAAMSDDDLLDLCGDKAMRPIVKEEQDRRKNAAVSAAQSAANPLKCKVSEKTGALSVYGLQARFPVTLYAGQWERLFAYVPTMKEFIRDNPTLARK